MSTLPVRKPIIAIAGLACETSTFSPSRTLALAFQPRRGLEVLAKYPFLHPGAPLADAAEWHGALIGHALPGGIVTREAFEELAAEIVARLRAIVAEVAARKPSLPSSDGGAPGLDGLWFDIHGAMCVEGIADAEAELLRRVRRVIGREVVVSASMDLHGNVSEDLVRGLDLVTCYRTAPHVDVLETKQRACANLLRVLGRRPLVRPLKAWIPVPVLLPGEKTSTRMQPASRIYEEVGKVADGEGVLDAAVWVGYAWADEPRSCAAVVVTGWDEGEVRTGAERLARLFWDVRDEFEFVAPHGEFGECLDTALASSKRPYFVSESGDNPTAGGAGDVTWALKQVLGRSEFQHASGPKVVYASIPGPEAVRAAVKAGVGATVTVRAGAEVDNVHMGPVEMTGRVHAIRHGDRWAETEVVLEVGSVYVIVTKLRKPYHLESDFTKLDLQPRRGVDIVIVKIGYLEPELFDMASDWMLALTPGGVDQDLERLGHTRISRPMWPFDKTFSEPPDLTARLVS